MNCRRSRPPASPAIWSSRCAPPRSPRDCRRRTRSNMRSPTASRKSTKPTSPRRPTAKAKRPVDSGRRGQRDQRAAGARAADAARPSPGHCRQWRSRGGVLDQGARRRRALRPRPDGRADAGHGRAGSHPPHSRRRSRATRSHPPTRIVALTANAYAEDRDACLAAGMDGLLVKPLDRERLRDALETASPARGSCRVKASFQTCHKFVSLACCRELAALEM